MKYEVVFPPEVDQLLTTQANASGQDVANLIQYVVLRYVGVAAPVTEAEWLPEMKQRRSELIDKDIAGTITMMERLELADLDRRGNAYYDQVAAPPMDGARILHQKLTQLRGHQ